MFVNNHSFSDQMPKWFASLACEVEEDATRCMALSFICHKPFQVKWFGHVQRKPDNEWTKRCFEYPKLGGPNCKGRPKMTWMEVINRDLRELGICKEDAADRARWKRLIGRVDRSMLDG